MEYNIKFMLILIENKRWSNDEENKRKINVG